MDLALNTFQRAVCLLLVYPSSLLLDPALLLCLCLGEVELEKSKRADCVLEVVLHARCVYLVPSSLVLCWEEAIGFLHFINRVKEVQRGASLPKSERE